MSVAILLLVLFANVSAFNYTQYFQTDYIIDSQRFEKVSHNEEYIGGPVIKNFKFNRTHFAVNLTAVFKLDIGDSLVIDIQAYKFSSNEYRLFPISFPIDVCQAIYKNVFGAQNLYNCGNMFKCPIKKGAFQVCNWMPDYSKFPPRFPRGAFMLEIKWMYFKTEFMHTNWYMSVKDAPL